MEPKFKVGDIVIHDSILTECEERWKTAVFLKDPTGITIPKIYIVTHVLVQSCFGGCQQIQYQVEHAEGVKRWSETCIRKATDSTEIFMKYALQLRESKEKGPKEERKE